MRKAVFGWMVAAALVAQGAAAQDTERRIYVTGVGEAQVVPDVATLTIGVTREEKMAREAMEGVAQTMTELFEVLDGLGIADEDRQTSNFMLRPVERDRDNGGDAGFKGFVARNMLTLTIRDVGALGAVIDALSLTGANAINGIGFDVSEPGEHLTEARKAAARRSQRRRSSARARSTRESLTAFTSAFEIWASRGSIPASSRSRPPPRWRPAPRRAAC